MLVGNDARVSNEDVIDALTPRGHADQGIQSAESVWQRSTTSRAAISPGSTRTAATAWNPGANNGIFAIVFAGNIVYAAGTFDAIGGQYRGGIAAIDVNTGMATAWDPEVGDCGAYITCYADTLAVSGSTVYVAGFFAQIGGQPPANIAAIDASSGLATGWNPGTDDYAYGHAFAITGGRVYAGGGFSHVGGQPRSGIAALTPADEIFHNVFE